MYLYIGPVTQHPTLLPMAYQNLQWALVKYINKKLITPTSSLKLGFTVSKSIEKPT